MLLRDDLLDRLDRLDEAASLVFDKGQHFRMVLVGGAALVLMEYTIRSTHDIDALEAPRELHSMMQEYDINMQSRAYCDSFPYNYEDRLVLLEGVGGRRLYYYCMSLEDSIISKLHRMGDNDTQDLTSDKILGSINWTLLEQLKKEARMSALSENSTSHKNFLHAYGNYVREYRP
ncbi:MAG: DUF6036 family nucleotidyltransferase [Coriobacteriia bacterium]|nr:DUF6036 family nucleotidyltransferase [Coriobacteriia bacterium]